MSKKFFDPEQPDPAPRQLFGPVEIIERTQAKGLDFDEDIARELLNLEDWHIEYEVCKNFILIVGAVKNP